MSSLRDDLPAGRQLVQDRAIGAGIVPGAHLRRRYGSGLEHGEQFLLRRHVQPGLFGRRGEQHPTRVGNPVATEPVDFLQFDLRHVALRKCVFVGDSRKRLSLQEGASIFRRVGGRLGVLALFPGALVSAQHVRLLAIQLRGGEAVSLHPLGFDQQSLEAAGRLALGHGRLQLVYLASADQPSLARTGVQEGRTLRFPRDFVEPEVEHRVVRPLDHGPAIVRVRPLGLGGQLPHDADLRHLELGIGDRRYERLRVDRNRERRSLRSIRTRLDALEAIADHRPDLLGIEVADRDHRHQVRAVPVLVEPPQGVVSEALEDLRIADRQAFRVAGAAEQDRELLVLHP